MSVQRTFNLVINSGYYGYKRGMMCCSLNDAYLDGVIAKREWRSAKQTIKEYLLELGGCLTLESSLRRRGLPSSFEDRKKIYQNWDSRPRFKVSLMRRIINRIKVKLNV